MNLSKSLYTRGLQCVKSLWLKKYNKKALSKPDKSTQAVFETGDEVGELACKLFPNGVKVEFNPNDYDGMVNTTKQLISDGIKNIYEASFNFNGIFVAVDILHINDDSSVEIYEVKSSTWKPETKTKDIQKYINDISIQYYVLKNCGLEIKKANLVLLNSQYVRDEELELDKLFKILNLTSEVYALQEEIPYNLKRFEKVLQDDKNEPNIDIGKHCNYPYACDGIEYCWKHIPEYSIFDISRLRSDKKFELYKDGIINFNQITNIDDFSSSQQIQILSEQQNKTIINKKAIKEFCDSLTYPIYHLDFETFQQAVPKWSGISPYMQIPFQYSLHIEQENGDLEHKEFLAKQGIDPRYELAKRLVEDIPTDVTVLAYNMSFEKGVIKKLANIYGEFTEHLMNIHDNIKDLMIPFKDKDYYVPSMKGSYSIKYVLPALVPKMAKAYKELNLVQNGGDAMQAYPRLATMQNEDEIKRLREALLKYCELDTLAMVEVLRKLKERVR